MTANREFFRPNRELIFANRELTGMLKGPRSIEVIAGREATTPLWRNPLHAPVSAALMQEENDRDTAADSLGDRHRLPGPSQAGYRGLGLGSERLRDLARGSERLTAALRVDRRLDSHLYAG